LEDGTSSSAAAPSRPAFTEIYREHATFVWRTLRRLGVRPADLEDVCQEAFVVVHRRVDGFDGQATKSWLFAIAQRVAADYRKRAYVRRERPHAAVPETAAPPTQHDQLERQRARDFLQQALDQLDDDKRAVFVLYELEQMPMAEVARAVSCPLQTAYSRLHAARKYVRECLARAERRLP
jgi:RNA polymerase sigma-70 factor (ECF subfamily)